MIVVFLACFVSLCLSKTNICSFKKKPRINHFEVKSYLVDGEFRVNFEYPILGSRINYNSGNGEYVEEFVGMLEGSLSIQRTTECAFEAYRKIPRNALEIFSGVEHLNFYYQDYPDLSPFSFMFQYNVVHNFNAIPKSNTIGVALFQVVDFYEHVDEERAKKTYHWLVEVQHYGEMEIFFRGLLSNRASNSSLIKQEYDKYDNSISFFEIFAEYDIDYNFKSETCFFQFQRYGQRNFVDHIVDIRKLHTGYVSVIPDHEEDEIGLVHASQLITVKSRNESFTSLSVSSNDKITISTFVVPLQEKREIVSNLESEMERVTFTCTNCEEETEYVFEMECSSLENIGCFRRSKFEMKDEYTLVLDQLDPGNYEIESKVNVRVIENGEEKSGYVELFSHLLVSKYNPAVTLMQILLFAPVLIAGAGGIGLGMYILRVLEKKSGLNKGKIYTVGKIGITKSGKDFPLIDLRYHLRHKDIVLKKEDEKSLAKKFLDIFRLQKASKYTAYVHCKHCYLEQQESKLNLCCKCGLPLASLLEFKNDEKFCIICSLMSKYQPRPHGRCLLHLSSSRKKNCQGSVYVLYKDHYSVGSASRQLKKCSKNDWIERVTQEEIWKLNSLMRFEYMWLIKDLFYKDIKSENESFDVLQQSINKVTERLNQVGPEMRSEHYRRLKINYLTDGSFSEKNIIKFCDSYRKLLIELIGVLNRNLNYLQRTNRKRKEKKRKREPEQFNVISKKFKTNSNKVIVKEKQISYIPRPSFYEVPLLTTVKKQIQEDDNYSTRSSPSTLTTYSETSNESPRISPNFEDDNTIIMPPPPGSNQMSQINIPNDYNNGNMNGDYPQYTMPQQVNYPPQYNGVQYNDLNLLNIGNFQLKSVKLEEEEEDIFDNENDLLLNHTEEKLSLGDFKIDYEERKQNVEINQDFDVESYIQSLVFNDDVSINVDDLEMNPISDEPLGGDSDDFFSFD